MLCKACGYEKLQVFFVILFLVSEVCLTLGGFVRVINRGPLLRGIFGDHLVGFTLPCLLESDGMQ